MSETKVDSAGELFVAPTFKYVEDYRSIHVDKISADGELSRLIETAMHDMYSVFDRITYSQLNLVEFTPKINEYSVCVFAASQNVTAAKIQIAKALINSIVSGRIARSDICARVDSDPDAYLLRLSKLISISKKIEFSVTVITKQHEDSVCDKRGVSKYKTNLNSPHYLYYDATPCDEWEAIKKETDNG